MCNARARKFSNGQMPVCPLPEKNQTGKCPLPVARLFVPVGITNCGSCLGNTAIILLKLAKRQIFCLQNYCFIWSCCCSGSHVTHSTARHLWLRSNEMALMSRDTKYRGQDRAGSDISQSDSRSLLSFDFAALEELE